MIAFKDVSRGALAFVSLALIASLSAGAQPIPGTTKTVFENDKVVVVDNVLKPGEESHSADRGGGLSITSPAAR